MFHKTSITPKIEDSKFIEVTSKNMDRFKDLPAEDKTNLTPDNRHIDDYNYKLKTNLTEIIIKQAKLSGRKINLLDSGCGQCVSINDLLSNPKLKDSLGTCTGISMNYFKNVERVMKKHGDRFHYYYGKVQDVLNNTQNQFDIIIDMAGAYLYSVDKIYLMKLYHQALRPGGIAEIWHGGANIQIKNEEKPFFNSIGEKHPKTFLNKNGTNAFTMAKAFRKFPLPELNVVNYSEHPSISWTKKLSTKEVRKGNALWPFKIQYELSDDGKKRRRLA